MEEQGISSDDTLVKISDHWLQLMSLRVGQQKNNCMTIKNSLA